MNDLHVHLQHYKTVIFAALQTLQLYEIHMSNQR